MSADNWAICPKCWAAAVESKAVERAAMLELYGKVPVEEFDRVRVAFVELKREDFRTFREDYEIGLPGVIEEADVPGAVVIHYRGGCKTCGLSFKLDEEHPVWP